ncbi:hypothetical protein D3C71_1802570 [compost metagenome]
MPVTSDPSATAADFVRQLFADAPIKKIPLGATCVGCWRAQTPDGSWVTYRPAGQASGLTSPTTATVEVNSPGIRILNVNSAGSAKSLKLKFPVKSEVP